MRGRILAFTLLVLAIALIVSCGDDGGDDPVAEGPNDEDAGNDDRPDDEFGDDDQGGDDDDQAPAYPPPTPNPTAKADGFRLFYRERSLRALTALNRYSLSGDAAFANAFALASVARSGNEIEVVPGPENNNPFGKSLYSTWKLYKAIGGRELELSLVRMFEGLAFHEAITGHPGLTTREPFPGWTRTMDGVTGTVTRTRNGEPVTPPDGYVFSEALEKEVLDTFFAGTVVTYREDPVEWLFSLKPAQEVGSYSTTYVFDELDHDPPFLRVSDCCKSHMISQRGVWTGAVWGNHNSRDNFTDYATGYLAAFEAERTAGLPDDLAAAAAKAGAAARRVGDLVEENDNVLMTVDERHDYDTLVAAGWMNPDGEVEWQDLGSLAACQMAYVAQAVSSEGLTVPVPELPLPGAIETSTIRLLFTNLGIDPPPLPVHTCRSVDDAFVGKTWGDLLDAQLFGIPLWDVADRIAEQFPELFPDLLGGMMDDFAEMMLGTVVLCEYARIMDDDALYAETLASLDHFVELQRIVARLVYGVATDERVIAACGADAVEATVAKVNALIYRSAAYARMFSIDSPMEDFEDFAIGDENVTHFENWLVHPDTQPAALMSDAQIAATVEAHLERTYDRAPWRVERYRERFGYTYPVRRAGDGYEAIGPEDDLQPVEIPRHELFEFGPFDFWFEAPLCEASPETLDCTWAGLGCAACDLDASGAVDVRDRFPLEDAFAAYGVGGICSDENQWCDGGDTDRSGVLDDGDREFMDAAQGCWY